jgi:hypothetical protein
MSFKGQIEKIKDLMQARGTINVHPENGLEAIVVKEQLMGKSYTATVAVGITGGFGGVRYFEVQGNVWEDSFNRFNDSSYRIEPNAISRTKGASYMCVIMPQGFIRKVDEAKWAGNFNGLDDLITLLEGL